MSTDHVVVPDGVFTVLPGHGPTTGKQLASHPLVQKVDITVSSHTTSVFRISNSHTKAGTHTGRELGAVVGANLVAFTAELGGKVSFRRLLASLVDPVIRLQSLYSMMRTLPWQ